MSYAIHTHTEKSCIIHLIPKIQAPWNNTTADTAIGITNVTSLAGNLRNFSCFCGSPYLPNQINYNLSSQKFYKTAFYWFSDSENFLHSFNYFMTKVYLVCHWEYEVYILIFKYLPAHAAVSRGFSDEIFYVYLCIPQFYLKLPLNQL